MDYLGNTTKDKLNESIIAGYVNQILNALSHCHSQDIIHGDLRPSNVVFADVERKLLKLINFRYGDRFDPTDPKNQDVFGSPGYTAPEVLNDNMYTNQSDIWSCGILTYYMFTGELPYDLNENTTVKDLFNQIKAASFTEESFKGPIWDRVSPECKKFIASMLNSDPEKRLTAESLSNDEWLKNTTTTPLLEKEEAKGEAKGEEKEEAKEEAKGPLPKIYVGLKDNN